MFVAMERERLINRRQQGDLGEASAIEWLTRAGGLVSVPFGHSPNYDVLADFAGQILRVQVKTSVCQGSTPGGHARWSVGIATRGGNQSWSVMSSHLDPEQFDWLFVLVGDGRRWFIPAAAIDAGCALQLGAKKYARYEIDAGDAINNLVYGPPTDGPKMLASTLGGVSKRSTDGACKASGSAFAGSNPAAPTLASSQPIRPTRYERKLGQAGQAVINQKRRVTIPQRAFFEAGLANGARLCVRAVAPGKLLLQQIELPDWAR